MSCGDGYPGDYLELQGNLSWIREEVFLTTPCDHTRGEDCLRGRAADVETFINLASLLNPGLHFLFSP
jgi:hypothetical protein